MDDLNYAVLIAPTPRGLVAAGTDGPPFVDLIGLGELDATGMCRVTRGELDLLVARTPAGIVVTDDRCPHMAAPLSIGSLDGCVVGCPLHEGQFDLCSGETVQMPTTGGLDADGLYHPAWSPTGVAAKPEPPTLKIMARRLTRVRRLRYYPARIAGERIEARLPEGFGEAGQGGDAAL